MLKGCFGVPLLFFCMSWPLSGIFRAQVPQMVPWGSCSISWLVTRINLPSVIHYWKRVLCRGPEDLPRAKSRALGKDALCRGSDTRALGKERPSAKRPLSRVRPSAKTGPRQIKSLPRAEALGKDVLGKLGPLGHGGHFPSSFAEGHPLGPRQRFFFCETIFCGKFFLSLCGGP